MGWIQLSGLMLRMLNDARVTCPTQAKKHSSRNCCTDRSALARHARSLGIKPNENGIWEISEANKRILRKAMTSRTKRMDVR